MDETDEQLLAHLAAMVGVPGRYLQPIREQVRSMSMEQLRDVFDRGAFEMTTTWDDLLRIRAEEE